MSVHSNNTLSVGHKIRLRKQIIAGARHYNKYLAGKIFKIVCEDGMEVDIRFHVTDFKHMTGLCSNLGNKSFYEKCVSGTIDIGNIDTNQKYNWNTLRIKGNHIEKIHELLYKDCSKTLLLEMLDTHTYVFPYAVKNTSNNMCVGFVSSINKARSVRKASTSTKFKFEKNVIAVFAKSAGCSAYHELIYVSNVLGMYKKNESLLNELDDVIQMRFLELITRP